MIEKEKYEEYKNSLLNIARLTNKENSVLISFEIKEDICINKVNFIQQDGTKDLLKDSNFICDNDFYTDFLEKFIIDYYENMVIAFSDNIDMNADGKYTYRIVTDDNDMMSVDGISLEYANHLMNLVNKEDKGISSISKDEVGGATAIATLILVGGIGLSLLLMVMMFS